MKAPKKRTRRAVKRRRTLDERETVALEKLELWLSALQTAARKVEEYRRELKQVRSLRAARAADEVFGEE